LIKYSHQTAKAKALCEFTDGRTGQPADTLPNLQWLQAVNQSVTEVTVSDN
jgi:hypothetical protein